jgi:sugar transferase (PEP-CTERM/EpsH1 system associated)
MNVLFVCHRFPFPPKRGGKIRPFNIIRHLHAAGHAVTVASLARSDEEAEEGRGLEAYCEEYLMGRVREPAQTLRMVGRLATSSPSSMGYFYSPELANGIRKKLSERKFDLIFVHCSSVAPYVAGVDGPVKMLDFGDMDSEKWLTYSRFRKFPLSAGYWLEGRKLQRAEKRLARQFDMCTCTTRAEYETLESFATGVPADWFPNGVDAEFFAPDDSAYDPNLICFVGRMDYYPNQQAVLDFCRDVLPLIQAARPGVRLVVVGADPSAQIRQLSELPGVDVTGSVPDVRPWVRKAALSVAPLSIARGTQNKILESMAMGVPVVASREASGGIDAVPETHFLAASTASQYRDAILRMLDAPQERQKFSEAGRQRVLSHHNWDASLRKLETLIEDCMSRCRAPAGPDGRSRIVGDA